MANNGGVIVPPDSTGKTVDCSSLSVGGVTAYRQRIVIADPTHSANFAVVSAGGLAINGAVGLNAGTNNIGGVSLVAGTAKIGRIANISATVLVAGSLSIGGLAGNTSATAGSTYTLIGGMDGSIGRVALTDAAGHFVVTGTVALAAGTQHIGEVNISTMPAVVLAAGTANIGTLNGISATVNVNVTNHITVDAISATVNVAGTFTIGSLATGTNNIGTVGISSGTFALSGTLDGISAPVVLAAGTNNIGTINNISATVLVAGSLTIGGQTGNASATVGSTYTLIGGMDGAIGRVALTDAAGHFVVTGTVALAAGSNNIGTIQAISAAVGLAAGTQHIGEVNISTMPAVVVTSITNAINVSAMPSLVLAAGTANFGTLNNISATVLVAGSLTIGGTTGNTSVTAGSSFTVIGGYDGSLGRIISTDITGAINTIITNQVKVALTSGIQLIGAVSLGAGTANFGTLNNISATVTVLQSGFFDSSAGSTTLVRVGDSANSAMRVNIVAAAGTANLGTINNISATVLVAGSLTIGGQAGNASATVGSTYTLIGGMDGALGRVALTDAAGHFVITGTVALTTLNGLGKIDGISAAVSLASLNGLGKIDGISAAVSIASLNGLGKIDGISAAVVLATGTNNIGSINNISANVNVVLQTGTNNIGTIQAISAAVGLAAGTQHIGEVNISIMPAVVVTSITNAINVSAMPNIVLATGTNNIGTVQAISAAVVVNGMVAFNTSITAGNSPILMGGRVKTSASTTATAHSANHLWLDKNGRLVVINGNPALVPSASHGPKTVTISTSASVALIASGGAGTVAYVTGLTVTNGSSTLTRADIYEASATATPVVAQYLAASGGGFSMQFNPPWRVSAATVLNARVKPSVSQCLFTVHFYVGVD